MIWTRRASIALAAVVAAMTACNSRPKVGDACRNERSPDGAKATPVACADDRTYLVCVGGKFEPMPCPGPKGCTPGRMENKNEFYAMCDFSTAREGDACVQHEQTYFRWERCDGVDAVLVCIDKAFRRFAVRGPGGCRDDKPLDFSVAVEGEPCLRSPWPMSDACSRERTALLRCDGPPLPDDIQYATAGTWVRVRECRGCRIEGGGGAGRNVVRTVCD
ncbi:MAG: hypothetical protein HY908_26460 [Myxococcales bacterium]|nr:hypothetical protein [Myxococcales bacterium]